MTLSCWAIFVCLWLISQDYVCQSLHQGDSGSIRYVCDAMLVLLSVLFTRFVLGQTRSYCSAEHKVDFWGWGLAIRIRIVAWWIGHCDSSAWFCMVMGGLIWGVKVSVIARGKGTGFRDCSQPGASRQTQLMDTGCPNIISGEMIYLDTAKRMRPEWDRSHMS